MSTLSVGTVSATELSVANAASGSYFTTLYAKANTSGTDATNAYGKANAALANTTTTFAGDLTVAGNVSLSSAKTITIGGVTANGIGNVTNQLVQVQSGNKLPVLDGSNLTNVGVPAANTTTLGSRTVTQFGGLYSSAGVGNPGTAASNTQTFNCSSTWTKPASGTWVRIQMWGGGGGGTGANRAGGGGGAYNQICLPFACINNGATVTVGAGGSSTGAGGTSSVATVPATYSAYGGQSGSNSTYGGRGGGLLSCGGPGLGFTPSAPNCYVGAAPGAGGPSFFGGGGLGQQYTNGGPSVFGGGGGAGYAGQGGSSVYGGGGGSGACGGSGGASVFGGNGGSSGSNGSVPGGGGGTSAGSSGSGGKGRVIITVY